MVRAAISLLASFLAVSAILVLLLARFPDQPLEEAGNTIEALGIELLGDSMLVFESAGVAHLATMLGADILCTLVGSAPAGAERCWPSCSARP